MPGGCYATVEECGSSMNAALPSDQEAACMDGVLEKYKDTANAMIHCQAQAY